MIDEFTREMSKLSLKQLRKIIDRYEAKMKQAVGQPREKILFDRIAQLKELIDHKIRHSDGKGLPYEHELKDITETRENYGDQVPQTVFQQEAQEKEEGTADSVDKDDAEALEGIKKEETPVDVAGKRGNIIIVIQKGGKVMKFKNFDEYVAKSIENEDFLKSDVRIPLNLRKADVMPGAKEVIGEVREAKKDEKDAVQKRREAEGRLYEMEAKFKKECSKIYDDIESKLEAIIEAIGVDGMGQIITNYENFKSAMNYLISKVSWKLQGDEQSRPEVPESISSSSSVSISEGAGKGKKEKKAKKEKKEHGGGKAKGKFKKSLIDNIKETLEKAQGGSLVGGLRPAKVKALKNLYVLLAKRHLLKREQKLCEGNVDKTFVIGEQIAKVQEEIDQIIRNSEGKGLVMEEELGGNGVPDYEFQSVFDARLKSQAIEEVKMVLEKAQTSEQAKIKETQKAGAIVPEIDKFHKDFKNIKIKKDDNPNHKLGAFKEKEEKNTDKKNVSVIHGRKGQVAVATVSEKKASLPNKTDKAKAVGGAKAIQMKNKVRLIVSKTFDNTFKENKKKDEMEAEGKKKPSSTPAPQKTTTAKATGHKAIQKETKPIKKTFKSFREEADDFNKSFADATRRIDKPALSPRRR